MALFEIEWLIDRDGYSLAPSHLSQGNPYAGPDDREIVRKGGRLLTWKPFKTDGLCRRIAQFEDTPAGALQFVARHGFMFRANTRSESAALICSHIQIARVLVRAADARDWTKITGWLEKAYKGGRGVGRLGVVFETAADTSRPALHLRPANLWEAAVVQLLEEISSGRPLKHCKRPGCPEWFTYGPGTDHRETALYCSSKCQNAHTYMKRKELRS
jgi:hypothetical protein